VIGFPLSGPVHGDDKPLAKPPRLEFRILANEEDDGKALEAAKKYFAAAAKDAKVKEELKKRAAEGEPPTPVKVATDKAPGYSWLEIARAYRHSLRLDNASAEDAKPLAPGSTIPHNAFWKEVAEARDKGEPLLAQKNLLRCLLYSRSCQNTKLSKEERERKKFEYFLLTRDPRPGKALTGEHVAQARAGVDSRDQPCAFFELNKKGTELMAELSSSNLPSIGEDPFKRHLAIILDRQIVMAPFVNQKIGSKGQIGGGFTRQEVDDLVTVMRGQKK
jgi:hypothetical protein